jgi:hypothetical protein
MNGMTWHEIFCALPADDQVHAFFCHRFGNNPGTE